MSEENCTGSCGSCKADCASRQPSKEDLLEPANKYSKIKRVIGVVSGKGGVGKSFVTSYLSVCMQKKGYQTAILDADITGPSIPKSFGIKGKVSNGPQGIVPAESENGTKVMSINLLMDKEDAPVIWRGPVIAGAVKQFWTEVAWGNVDSVITTGWNYYCYISTGVSVHDCEESSQHGKCYGHSDFRNC